MTLLEIIDQDLIKVPLEGNTKNEVIEELVDLLEKKGCLDDRADVLSQVYAREAMGSTGLEKGIAIPHAKSTGVKSTVLAVGIKPGGIDFNALDGNPSSIFFMILAPPSQSAQHIEILSEIAKATTSAAFCRVLSASRNAEEVLELFNEE
ncbi:MAG: PTS sugar transporter subunit IIA [Spirochaetales bacterium]|nr:PTS sugar transporter subunit IIA [Spirochaetales bacterium]